jgi:hypothetical protein
VPIGTSLRHVAYLQHAKLFIIIFYQALAPNGAIYWFVILNAVKYLFAAMYLAEGIAFASVHKRDDCGSGGAIYWFVMLNVVKYLFATMHPRRWY